MAVNQRWISVLFYLGLALINCRHTQLEPVSSSPGGRVSSLGLCWSGDKSPENLFGFLPSLFREGGEALVRVVSEGWSCEGVLILYRGEIVPLFASHCLSFKRDTDTVELRLAVYFEHPLLGQDNDERWREGYIFPAAKRFANLPVTSLKFDKNLDLAYVRGLFPSGLPAGHRALTLTSTAPRAGDLVMGFHRHTFKWYEEDSVTGIARTSEADVLTPNFGFFIGVTDHLYAFFFPSFKGDSGSSILNHQKQVIGIVWKTLAGKRGKIETLAIRTPYIVAFFEATWDQ